MCVQNLKFVASPIPEIIGGTQKIGQSLDTPTLPLLPNFSWAFVRMAPVYVSAKFTVRIALPVHEIIAIAFLGGVANPNLGEGEAVRSRGWYRSKERW